MTISNGLPKSRAEWPPEVLEACRSFACGDVVETPPYFYYADAKYAVMQRTGDYFDAAYSGAEIIDAADWAAPFGVITTQTCDLGEIDFDPPVFPFISVSPVFDAAESLDGSSRKLLREGKRIGPFLHLPLVTERRSGFWVADFRLEVPIEKSWLVGKEPIKGFATETDARLVPDALHDLRSRPAWAAVINECVESAMRLQLDQLKKGDRELYEMVVREIDKIGARADSMLLPKLVTLAAFTRGEALSVDVMGWWNQVTIVIADGLSARGVHTGPSEVHSLLTCPVTIYELYSPVTLGGKYSPR